MVNYCVIHLQTDKSKQVQTCPNIQPAAASLIGTPLTFDPETCSLHACDGCSQQESIQRSVLRDIHKFTKKLPVLVSFQLFRRQEVKIKHAKFLRLAPNSLHRAVWPDLIAPVFPSAASQELRSVFDGSGSQRRHFASGQRST